MGVLALGKSRANICVIFAMAGMLPRTLNFTTAGIRAAINRPLVVPHEISTLGADKMATGPPQCCFFTTPEERNEQ